LNHVHWFHSCDYAGWKPWIDNWINDVLHTFDGTTSSLLCFFRHLFAVVVFVIKWVKQLRMCVSLVSFLIKWCFEALLIQKRGLHTIPLFLAQHEMRLTWFSWVISLTVEKTRPYVIFTFKVDYYLYNKNDNRYHFCANNNFKVSFDSQLYYVLCRDKASEHNNHGIRQKLYKLKHYLHLVIIWIISLFSLYRSCRATCLVVWALILPCFWHNPLVIWHTNSYVGWFNTY
jgi:hypothetical protein